jgi:hypothetical protein
MYRELSRRQYSGVGRVGGCGSGAAGVIREFVGTLRRSCPLLGLGLHKDVGNAWRLGVASVLSLSASESIPVLRDTSIFFSPFSDSEVPSPDSEGSSSTRSPSDLFADVTSWICRSSPVCCSFPVTSQ